MSILNVKMLQPMFRLLFLSMIVLSIVACSEQSKSKNAMGLAKMLESDFKGKDEATAKIHKVVEAYKANISNDSLGFDARYALYSQNYLNKVKSLINHAKYSNKQTVNNLMISQQMQVFNFRSSFTLEQLETLTVKEILTIQNKETFNLGGSSIEFKNLLFYNSQQASGAFKNLFSISPVLFDKEGDEWKIDIFGDPLHQKMKEEKLASLQQKSYAEYKEAMREILDIKEDSWIPLKDR